MLDFIVYIIKYTVIFACNLYVFAKITASRLKIWDFFFIFLFAGCALGLSYVTFYAKIFVPIAILLISVVVFLLRFKQPLSETVALSMVSFGITIFAMVMGLVPVYPILLPIYVYVDQTASMQIGQIVQAVFIAVIILVAFHTKKLKNSLTPATNNEIYDRLLLASTICIFSMTLFYTVDKTDATLKVIAVVIVFSGLALVSQWRKTVTSRYYKKLEQRNLARLEAVLENCEKERAKLIKENARLSQIIHRDNKYMPALQGSVVKLSEKFPEDKSLKKLAETIKSVYAERSGLIESYSEKEQGGNKTGVLSIDAVMDYFRMRAAKNDVEFTYDFEEKAFETMLNIFEEQTPLNETLCDLVENALIAVRGAELCKVALRVETENGSPCIKVFDSGADFDESVLRNMGRRRITTHGGNGGSGIGLMTLFDTLRSFKASYYLDEMPQGGFKKCVCITFDGKDGYAIRSARPCVKKVCAERENFVLIEE